MSAPPSLTASTLIHQRCWIHGDREAVARCAECSRNYCRECVTEHAGRMICAACVAREAGKGDASVQRAVLRWAVFSLGGLVLAWVVFYYAGTALARIPSDFHL